MNLKAAIKASLDGKKIQLEQPSGWWNNISTEGLLRLWLDGGAGAAPEFREEPKPDRVVYRVMNTLDHSGNSRQLWYEQKQRVYNLSDYKTCPDSEVECFKLTYDGETNELKSVEIVK